MLEEAVRLLLALTSSYMVKEPVLVVLIRCSSPRDLVFISFRRI